MPIESATFISQLVPANPLTTDPIAQADDHLRLVKSVLQSQFTNLGTVAVTASSTQINSAGTAFATAGTLEVPAGTASALLKLDPVSVSGAVLLENTGTSGAVGSLAVVMNDATNANPLTAMTLTRAGALSATTSLNAPAVTQGGLPIFPRGGIILWSGSIASVPSGWALCDGTNGTPNLVGSFIVGASGTVPPVGATGGSTTSSATTTTTGAHTHTGATGSAGAFSAVTDSQGQHGHTGSTASYALTIAQIPAHSHVIPLFTDVTNTSNLGQVTSKSGNAAVSGATDTDGGSGQSHAHDISLDGLHAHNLSGPDHTHTISSDGNHNHTLTVNTLPPYYALAWIMKL